MPSPGCPKFLIQPAPSQARQLPAWHWGCGSRLAAAYFFSRFYFFFLFVFLPFIFLFPFIFFYFVSFCLFVWFCSNACLFVSQAEANGRLLCKLFISRNAAR